MDRGQPCIAGSSQLDSPNSIFVPREKPGQTLPRTFALPRRSGIASIRLGLGLVNHSQSCYDWLTLKNVCRARHTTWRLSGCREPSAAYRRSSLAAPLSLTFGSENNNDGQRNNLLRCKMSGGLIKDMVDLRWGGGNLKNQYFPMAILTDQQVVTGTNNWGTY